MTTWLKLGRTQVKKLLESGRIRVDGRRVGIGSKGDKLPAGTRIEIEEVEAFRDQRAVPQPDLLLTVLAEGPGWIAVEKSAGLPVHPLSPDEQNTVLNAIIARHPSILGVGEGALRSGVVHRLDLDTSGVLLFATDQPTWQTLRDAFSSHRVKKTYRAIVEGSLKGSNREVMELTIAQHRPARVKVIPEPTKDSRTCDLTWRALEPLRGATLIEVDLGTGFLHQIRVMMAAKRHPVVGDRLYGGAMADAAPRQMLHASRLEIPDRHIAVSSPDPADFSATLDRLRLSGNP